MTAPSNNLRLPPHDGGANRAQPTEIQMKALQPVTDQRPGHARKPAQTITCECGATVLENDITKELSHVGPCTLERESSIDTFQTALAAHYTDLFENDPEYAYSAARISPEALAEKMTKAIVAGTGNKDGAGVKRTCKQLGINYTYKAIEAYLSAPGAAA